MKIIVDGNGDADAEVVAVAGFATDDGRVLGADHRLGDQVDFVVHLGQGFESSRLNNNHSRSMR